jgi:hypothetical protein
MYLEDVVNTRHLYDLRAVAEPALRTRTPRGVRTTNLVRSGTVTGDRINGRLLPAGGDWLLVDPAGVGHVDARYVIETDDDALIQAFYTGRVVFRGNALDRLRAGEALTEDDMYSRVALTFDAPEPYDWLNGVLSVGAGRAEPGADGTLIVHYRVHELI